MSDAPQTREYGDYYSDRLPVYHRLDVRVSHEIRTTRGRLLFFIDCYNLYDRANARNVVPYVNDLRGGRPDIRYSVDSLLPRLPSFGVQWEF